MGHRTTAAVTQPDPRILEERLGRLEARVAVIEGHAWPSAVPQLTAGELLRRRRKELGHTQSVAATELRVNQATVSKWERGDRIGWDHAADVAEYLGIPPVVLLAYSV